jgi:hypothetical protein
MHLGCDPFQRRDCGYANGPSGANNDGSAIMQCSVSSLKQIYTHISRVRMDGQISFAGFWKFYENPLVAK